MDDFEIKTISALIEAWPLLTDEKKHEIYGLLEAVPVVREALEKAQNTNKVINVEVK